MKHVAKILGIISLVFIFHSSYSQNTEIGDITIIDSESFTFRLLDSVNIPEGKLEGKIRVLSDETLTAEKVDVVNGAHIQVTTHNAIQPNTEYSLLTVQGAEGSIDFTTSETVAGSYYSNMTSTKDQDIDTVQIIDDTTMLVKYKQGISETEFEYKLLADAPIANMNNENKNIQVVMESPLESDQNYILMVVQLLDTDGFDIVFDSGIFDFTTPTFPEEIYTSIDDININTTAVDINDISTEMNLVVDDEILEDIDLESAPEEDVNLQKDIIEVSMSASQTPVTGAETWLLIFATLFINSFYYLARKRAA